MKPSTKTKLGPRVALMLELLSDGLSVKEIAKEIGINNPGTASCYLLRARRKFGCRTSEQMMFRLGKGEL